MAGMLAFFSVTTTTASPSWHGEAGTSYQEFRFTSNDPTPNPETVANLYGSPVSEISVTEPFGAGWQDPAVEYSLSGVNADGAWDLGPEGQIGVSLPVGPTRSSPSLEYDVDLFVYIVAYVGPVDLPVLSVSGHELTEETSNTELVQNDTLGSYQSITWTGRLVGLAANQLSLVAAAESNGALIDSIEIHSRYSVSGESAETYSQWVERNFPGLDDAAVTGFERQPDNDGIANGMKYYSGRDRFDASAFIRVESQGESSLTFSHPRLKGLVTGLTEHYEWSDDLNNWYASGEWHDGAAVSFSSVRLDASPPEFDILSVEATLEGNTAGAFFVRLRVEEKVL